jgi:hypothetical protein
VAEALPKKQALQMGGRCTIVVTDEYGTEVCAVTEKPTLN